MNIVRHNIPESTLEEFCEKHGFTVHVYERSRDMRKTGLTRYYCSVRGVEVKDGGLLGSVSGNGETEAEALYELAAGLSEGLLVVNAGGPDRREIQAPRLTTEAFCK